MQLNLAHENEPGSVFICTKSGVTTVPNRVFLQTSSLPTRCPEYPLAAIFLSVSHLSTCFISFWPSKPTYIPEDLKCLYQYHWETSRPLRGVTIAVHGMYTGLEAKNRAQGARKTSALGQTGEYTDFGKILFS